MRASRGSALTARTRWLADGGLFHPITPSSLVRPENAELGERPVVTAVAGQRDAEVAGGLGREGDRGDGSAAAGGDRLAPLRPSLLTWTS